MWSPNISEDFIEDDRVIQQELDQPFIPKHCPVDGVRDDGDSVKSDVHFVSTTKKSIGRIIFWAFFSMLLVVQFRVGLRKSNSPDNLHHYTVNWCIGVWIIASRLFRKAITDGRSAFVTTIPEIITCILVILVALGWLECAFLLMVVSITVLSLCVVVHSLYTLADFSSDL